MNYGNSLKVWVDTRVSAIGDRIVRRSVNLWCCLLILRLYVDFVMITTVFDHERLCRLQVIETTEQDHSLGAITCCSDMCFCPDLVLRICLTSVRSGDPLTTMNIWWAVRACVLQAPHNTLCSSCDASYWRDHYIPADTSLIPDGLTIQRSTLMQQIGLKRLLNC